MLSVEFINVFRGSSHVIVNVSIDVNIGEAVSVLGRNGAGKTTLAESIMGIVPAYNGSIKFGGVELVEEERNPFEVSDIVCKTARLGLGLVPEGRRIFSNLSVIENLRVGVKPTKDGKFNWNFEKIFELFPKLLEYSDRLAHHLSGGEKQMLTIARSLLGNPELLILDEPSEGLAPMIVSDLKRMLLRLKESGVALLIAEQNLSFIKGLADRVYVLENGTIKYQAPAQKFWSEQSEVERYLSI